MTQLLTPMPFSYQNREKELTLKIELGIIHGKYLSMTTKTNHFSHYSFLSHKNHKSNSIFMILVTQELNIKDVIIINSHIDNMVLVVAIVAVFSLVDVVVALGFGVLYS